MGGAGGGGGPGDSRAQALGGGRHAPADLRVGRRGGLPGVRPPVPRKGLGLQHAVLPCL